jgi:tetratricopeptide (TPR) repeat protein
MSTKYNVLFNGKQSYKAGLKKLEQNFKIDYSKQLPLYCLEDESARSSAFSDMDRAAVKAMKAIKLHSITVKPKRKSKSSKEYIKFRKKREYNELIDDCYLLKAKADYYNKKYLRADKSFKFLIRQFSGEEIVYESRIWYARSLIEQAKFTQVKEHLRALEKKGLPEKYRTDLIKLNAYYYMAISEDDTAIDNLERLVLLLKKKEKAYYSYLLAQMYRKVGDNAQAMNLFSKIPDMKVSYEMGFNAKINMAISYTGGGEDVLVGELLKLLKDKKNRDYKDQIYFALANIYQKKGNEKKAVKYYNLSVEHSVYNDVQKSTTFRVLGDYYYEKQMYEKSYLSYDSCFFYKSASFHGLKKLRKKYNSLSVLVDNIKKVSRQDSLLAVAAMSERERNVIIDKEIAKHESLEKFMREDKRKADLERSFYNQSKARSRNLQTNTSGAWYFYNVSMMSSGKLDFVRKWGRRKLGDDWNRKNKAIVEDIGFDDEEAYDDNEIKRDSLGDPKSRDYYLKMLPMTTEAKMNADSLILESLFTMGELYSDLINDYGNALRVYEDMLKRFPKNKYLLYIYYSAYNSSERLGDYTKRRKYKELVVSKFPDSEYARLVQDPSYLYQMQKSLSVIDNMYEQAYYSYEKSDFTNAINICKIAIDKYPGSALKDKFNMLRIYALAKDVSPKILKSEIEILLSDSPADELKVFLNGVLEYLERGYEPQSVDEQIAGQVMSSSEKFALEKSKAVLVRYEYKPDSRHYFILSFPRTGKNLNRLNYRLNVICSEVLEASILEVKKEQLGLDKLMFVISVLKDKDESLEIMDIMAKDKALAKQIDALDFRMFTISASNYKKLKFSEALDEYQSFFRKYYKENNKGEEILDEDGFSYMEDTSHVFVINFPVFSDARILLKAFNDYNSKNLSAKIISFDKSSKMLIVEGFSDKKQAMMYYRAAMSNKKLYKALKKARYSEFIISTENYNKLFAVQDVKKYVRLFKKWYLN